VVAELDQVAAQRLFVFGFGGLFWLWWVGWLVGWLVGW
jgi:hypothetical protein